LDVDASPDNSDPKSISPLRLRLATLLFPPLGMVLLWRMSARLWRKLLGSIFIALFTILYCALFIFILVRVGVLKIEWRGGYAPAFTWRKSLPNYDVLERHRADQSARLEDIAPESTEAQWPGFRGPNRDSHYDEKPILTNWPAGRLELLWRQPCGGGYSSFAIAHGWAFTLEQRRDNEVAVAYDFKTGRELWSCSWPDRFQEYFSEEGPRSTPTFDNGKLYVLGAMGKLRCLDPTGKVVWSKNIVVENHASVPSYGIASSPLVVGDKLIVQSSAGNGKSVLCLDKRDGKVIWGALDDATGYASPTLVNLAGQDQIIICAETRTLGLSIDDGKMLWEIPWRVLHNQMPIAQPVLLSTNRFLLSAGYFTGCAAVEVTPTFLSAKVPHELSDRQKSVVSLSPPDGERAGVRGDFSARIVWQNKNLKNKFTSSVFYQGYVYGLDEDILTCLDATTGERKWKDGRYGYGQLLLAGSAGPAGTGYLVILSGDGELALVKATPERHEELGRFQAIKGKTWNHPAIADGKILVRNAEEMACFQISP
jgi:outer membrane protein assembly factor BamB